MIELQHDRLVFAFPEVHPEARLTVTFQRTLRIPDDGRDYPLPPGLGCFPVCHVDDFAARVPPPWLEHGGVMLPMYPSEATWLSFQSDTVPEREASWPFAVKIATGKVCAVSGEAWRDGLHRGPQDYLVAPLQPWLDGFCVEKGVIRQFVAMPLGEGYSAEEQVTGKAEWGGVQILVYPMKRPAFERRFPKVERRPQRAFGDLLSSSHVAMPCCAPQSVRSMGLGAGGRMRQETYEDPYRLEEWDTDTRSRCFVHLADSMTWRAITGRAPPTVPFTAKEYTRAGLPWFEYYAEGAKAVEGSSILGKLRSIARVGEEKGQVPLPENESVTPERIVELRRGLARDQVREGEF